jgi:type I restriction enzyme R subunit
MLLPFGGYSPHAPVFVYRRHLPHWRQDGATYFVTFRLADSIPLGLAQRWQEERELWFAAHGLTRTMSERDWMVRYVAIPERARRAFERQQAHRLFAALDRCHGSCLLRDKAASEIAECALQHFHGTRLQCGDYVVMPNHVHWLVMPLKPYTLEQLLQSIKRYVSTRLRMVEHGQGGIWQKESYDRIVRDREELTRIRRYIAANPAKAHLPRSAFRYSRAEWLDL